MKLINKLCKASSVIVLSVFAIYANASEVTRYKVTGVFFEPNTQPNNTVFNGEFDWNGTTVSNLHGTMNSSMYDTDNAHPDYTRSYPLIHLDYQLAQSVNGNNVTVSVFKENTTNTFSGGGYQIAKNNSKGLIDVRYGYQDGNSTIENAFFTFEFDKTNMRGNPDNMIYADCTPGGMMGIYCMTGYKQADYGDGWGTHGGSMGGVPWSLTITAVPVPAAIWLLGSSLLALLGFGRRTVKAA